MRIRLHSPAWRTSASVVVCMVATLTTLVYSELGQEPVAPLLAVVAVALPFLLKWRRRIPRVVTLVSAGVAVLIPVGTSVALVALVSLLARGRAKWEWWIVGSVATATAVTFARDVLAPTTGTSFLKTILGPTDAPPDTAVDLGWWVVPLAVVLTVGPAVVLGMLWRGRRSERRAEGRVALAEKRSTHLGGQLARQNERARIAREVHDVLGHELSLLSLHAGALEVNATDTGLAESARQVRASAAHSLAGLQSLLRMLREDPDTDGWMTPLSLADLPAMIDETVATGIPVSSTVFLDRSEDADPALARAVYRVVQELLTNARKHGAGGPIRLKVIGRPGDGITVETVNPYAHAASVQEVGGSGQGLLGITERAELLGGHVTYGVDEGGKTFHVTVSLPWRASD